MSKLSKTLLIILTICVALALALGITYSVKKQEKEVDNTASAYEQLLEDLQRELNVSVQNVTELQLELDLKGLTIDDLTKTVTKYQTEVKTLKETVTLYETQIIEKDRVITEKETEVKEVEKQVTEYRDRIVELEADGEDNQEEIERLQGQIQELQNQIAEKDRTIADLRSQLANMTETKTQIETQVVEKERVITEKEQQIQEKEAENAQLVININVLNETIVNLNLKIELLEEALKKDPEKLYLSDIIQMDFIDAKLVYTENEDYFLFVGSDKFPGVYTVNKLDYSMEKKTDSKPNGYVHKGENGNYFIFSEGARSIVVYNAISNTCTSYDYDFNLYTYESEKIVLDNGDLFIRPCMYVNTKTGEITAIKNPKDGKQIFMGMPNIAMIDDDNILIADGEQFYKFTISTKEVINCEQDENIVSARVDQRFWINMPNGNVIFFNTLQSSDMMGLYLYDVEANHVYYKLNNIYCNNDDYVYYIDGDYLVAYITAYEFDDDNYRHSVSGTHIIDLNANEKYKIGDIQSYIYSCYKASDGNFIYSFYNGMGVFDASTHEETVFKNTTVYGKATFKEITTGVIITVTNSHYNDRDTVYTFFYDFATKQITDQMPEVLNISHYGVVMYYHDSVTTGHYPGYDDHATYSLVSSAYDGEEITISYQVFSGYKFKSFCYVTYPEGKPQYNFVAGQDGKFTVSKNMLHNGNVCIAMVIEQVN